MLNVEMYQISSTIALGAWALRYPPKAIPALATSHVEFISRVWLDPKGQALDPRTRPGRQRSASSEPAPNTPFAEQYGVLMLRFVKYRLASM